MTVEFYFATNHGSPNPQVYEPCNQSIYQASTLGKSILNDGSPTLYALESLVTDSFSKKFAL